MTTLEWAALPRGQVTRLLQAGAVPILPVAALEQHGDHLPTGTDLLLVDHVLRAAADRAVAEVLLLPPLPFGVSRYHAAFGGTVWLSAATLAAVIRDAARSVRDAGARQLLIVNGHGGNRGVLVSAGLEESDPAFAVRVLSYWDLASDAAGDAFAADRGSIGHAGQAETSLMLVAYPRLVGDVGPCEEIKPDVGPVITERLGESGVMGAASEGSAERGARFLEVVIDRLARLIDDVAHPAA